MVDVPPRPATINHFLPDGFQRERSEVGAAPIAVKSAERSKCISDILELRTGRTVVSLGELEVANKQLIDCVVGVFRLDRWGPLIQKPFCNEPFILATAFIRAVAPEVMVHPVQGDNG